MPRLTYREAIRAALREEMHSNDRVFLIGEDIAQFGGSMKVTEGLFNEFGPSRVRNAPISETAILGAAVGASACGLRPVAEIMYCDFFAVAMDPIVNQAAKMRYMFGGKLSLPLTIRSPLGGRRSAGAQHSQCLEAWFMHIPGVKVAMPSDAYDAKGLLKYAIRDPNPTIFLENKMLYGVEGDVPDEPYLVEFGQSKIVCEGSDVTVVAISDMVGYSRKAADQLREDGVSVEVIDPRTLVPLDIETIVGSVQKTGRLVIAHEANLTCGVGAEIASQVGNLAFDFLEAPIERVGAKGTPIPFSPNLEEEILPDDDDVTNAIRKVLDY